MGSRKYPFIFYHLVSMSCTSWVFRHKRIGQNPDNQASIIERSVLWREDSWEIGHFLTCRFDLPNGGYIYRDLENLKEIIKDAIDRQDWGAYDRDALTLLDAALNSVDSEEDDFFVSVDY